MWTHCKFSSIFLLWLVTCNLWPVTCNIWPVNCNLRPVDSTLAPPMESQMMQNPRNKIGLTFNKFVIKVKTDFNQAQQNQFTFNRFSLNVKTFRIKLNKVTLSLSRNYLSKARDIWIMLKRTLSLLSTKNFCQFHASFHINPKFPITFQQLDLSRSSRERCQQPKYFINNHAKHCQQSSRQLLRVLFMKYLLIFIRASKQ